MWQAQVHVFHKNYYKVWQKYISKYDCIRKVHNKLFQSVTGIQSVIVIAKWDITFYNV